MNRRHFLAVPFVAALPIIPKTEPEDQSEDYSAPFSLWDPDELAEHPPFPAGTYWIEQWDSKAEGKWARHQDGSVVFTPDSGEYTARFTQELLGNGQKKLWCHIKESHAKSKRSPEHNDKTMVDEIEKRMLRFERECLECLRQDRNIFTGQ